MDNTKDKKLNEKEVKMINGGFLPSGGTSSSNKEDARIAKILCDSGVINHGVVISSDDSKLPVGTKCGGIIRRETKFFSYIVKFTCSKCGGWHYSFSKNHIDTLEEFDLDPSSKALIEKERKKYI